MRLLILVCCTPLLACGQITPEAGLGEYSHESHTQLSYTVGTDRKSINILHDGRTRTCQVEAEIAKAVISFDESALIVSHDSYIPIEEIRDCGEQSITPKNIPPKSGILSDINLSHNIYIALLPVSTEPLSYLATVSNIQSDKNLISLPGAYVEGSSEEDQLQSAFVYSDDGESLSKIAKNGRYVSADGEIECSEDAYPGVWDILDNKKVVFLGNSSEKQCRELFY